MAIALVANAGIWVIVVIMPAVEAEFGATRAEVTLPYVVNMMGFAIGNFSLGRAVDKYGVTRTLMFAGVASIAGLGWRSSRSPS